MTNNNTTDNNIGNNGTGTSHRDAPPPLTTRPGAGHGFPFGYSHAPAEPPHLMAVAKLLSRDDRPHSLDDLLFELGRHGLALGYIGGEPAIVSVAGAPHRSLASMGLGDRWIESLGEWDRNVRHEPDEDELEYDGQDPGTDAIDRVWSSLDPLGRRLTQDERASVRQFLWRLPFGVVEDAMRIAADKIPDGRGPSARFRYFCGICLNKLRGRRAKRTSPSGRGFE